LKCDGCLRDLLARSMMNVHGHVRTQLKVHSQKVRTKGSRVAPSPCQVENVPPPHTSYTDTKGKRESARAIGGLREIKGG